MLLKGRYTAEGVRPLRPLKPVNVVEMFEEQHSKAAEAGEAIPKPWNFLCRWDDGFKVAIDNGVPPLPVCDRDRQKKDTIPGVFQDVTDKFDSDSEDELDALGDNRLEAMLDEMIECPILNDISLDLPQKAKT